MKVTRRVILLTVTAAAFCLVYAYINKHAKSHANLEYPALSVEKFRSNSEEHHYPTFELGDDFTLPHPYYYRELSTILSFGQSIWVDPLKDYLRGIHPAQSVTVIVASDAYTPNLLNWLISAKFVSNPPLENVLTIVFSATRTVYEMLAKRGIPCILVRLKSVVVGWSHGVGTVWMTRLALIRLLNYWGYDVQHFDTDAVVLRNPQPLFDHYREYDIVGSRGRLSKSNNDMWGFAICMGAVLFRSTPRTERLWHVMSGRGLNDTIDDQKRVNFVLNYTGLHWYSTALNTSKENIGITRDGLKVAILPTKYICRETCEETQTSDYYVWHEFGGGHNANSKQEQSSRSHVWFLRPDWKQLANREDGLTGWQWLRSLALPNSMLRDP